MGGSISAGADNDEMIDNLIKSRYIRTNVVEKVFRSVDRAFYFLAEFQHTAYRDLAWKQGNLHLSAPCIYSEVLEHLKLEPGHSFLNIGSGTGYLSTLAGLILGPYGTNHGIEAHADVVEYAYEKLEQFKRTCSGVDVFEFCEPVFVVGNAFNLNQDRRYDRIYCGAACPETHQEHIKKFMKVGGILVLPCEDDLLKIVRTSEETWEISSVLPVSFSTLQFPDKNTSTMISMPEPEPLRLQEICRSTVRSLLRSLVEIEEPELTQKRKCKQRSGSRKMYSEENCVVIPVFEDTTGVESAFTIQSSRFENFRPVAFERLIRNLARNYQNLNDDDDNNGGEAIENGNNNHHHHHHHHHHHDSGNEDGDVSVNGEPDENEIPSDNVNRVEAQRQTRQLVDEAEAEADADGDGDGDADFVRAHKAPDVDSADLDHQSNNDDAGSRDRNVRIRRVDAIFSDSNASNSGTSSVAEKSNDNRVRKNDGDDSGDHKCDVGASASTCRRINENRRTIDDVHVADDSVRRDDEESAKLEKNKFSDDDHDHDDEGTKIRVTESNSRASRVTGENVNVTTTVSPSPSSSSSSRPHQIAIKLRKGRFATKIKATKKHCSSVSNDAHRNRWKQALDDAEDSTSDRQPKKVMKREKLDSGISEESDDGKLSVSNESSLAESTSTNNDPMEIDSDQDSDFTEDEDSSCEENSSDTEQTETRNDPTNTLSFKYRMSMEKKIQTLPLPKAVKVYLNYDRDFLSSV